MDLTPDIFTADYTGEPGKRAFFLQARVGGANHTYRVEKAQIVVMAEKLTEMLLMIDENDTIKGAKPARDPALDPDPDEPAWRIGSVALAYDGSSDVAVLMLEEMPQTDDDDEDLEAVRFQLRRDQIRAFVLHAMAVVDEGREICQLCGLPKDPKGHKCPASNGHHPAE